MAVAAGTPVPPILQAPLRVRAAGLRRAARGARRPRRAAVVLRPLASAGPTASSSATRRRSSACSPRWPSAPAPWRWSAARSASSPSSPSSPAPRSGCRATPRSTSSAPANFTAFLSAYFNTREIAPLVAGLALSATVGCGFTAQLGAMRISEEVDALEVMGVPSLPFLVTTRMIAGFIAVIPLYVVGLLSQLLRRPHHHDRLLRPVDRHLRPVLPPVPATGGRACTASSRC